MLTEPGSALLSQEEKSSLPMGFKNKLDARSMSSDCEYDKKPKKNSRADHVPANNSSLGNLVLTEKQLNLNFRELASCKL
jgi:hypothetical protein